MTERESEILEIIKEDPLISQGDIAERLGITRSSVSVFITNMTRKGILRGRGYVVNEESCPVIVGATNLDIIGVCPEGYEGEAHRSAVIENAGIRLHYGGSAKNVAETMVRLGYKPQLITAVAADLIGGDMLRECRAHGIDVDASLTVGGAASSIILEVRDSRESRVLSGLRSTNIANRITPDFLRTKQSILRRAGAIMFEDKLGREAIEYISSSCGGVPLVFFATSHSGTAAYRDLLGRFSHLLISPAIAAVLTDTPHRSDEAQRFGTAEARQLARSVVALGAKSVYIPFGENKICHAGPAGGEILTAHPSPPAKSYTFTRDTVMAGLLHCIDQNFPCEKTLRILAACRAIAGESGSFVSPTICLDLIETTLQKMPCDIEHYRF